MKRTKEFYDHSGNDSNINLLAMYIYYTYLFNYKIITRTPVAVVLGIVIFKVIDTSIKIKSVVKISGIEV